MGILCLLCIHSFIPMTRVRMARNSEVENSQPIKNVRKCNDISKVPSGLNITRLFAFPVLNFLLVLMSGYLEDHGLMSSHISFVFLCGNPYHLCPYACFLILTLYSSPCHKEMERRLTSHLPFTTWISERRSLDKMKRVLAKSSPWPTTFPNLKCIWNHSEGWKEKWEKSVSSFSNLSSHWIFIGPKSRWESQ